MFCVKISVFISIGLIVLQSGLSQAGLIKTDVDDNNESGYFKKSNEAGNDGYQNYEKFDNKDGNEWGYEKAEAFGVSEHDDDSNDKTNTDYKDPHSYKVTEVQSEENKDDNSAKYTTSGNEEVEENESNENANDNKEYYQYSSDEDESSNNKSENSNSADIETDGDDEDDGDDDDDEPSREKNKNTKDTTSYNSNTYHEYPQTSAYEENESYDEADYYQNSHSTDESKDDNSDNDNDGIVDILTNEKNTKGIKIDKEYTKEYLRDDNANGCAGSKCKEKNNNNKYSKLIEYANYEVYHQ